MSKPKVLFFNVNGSGLGHMNRCLAYARRLKDKVVPVFFSLASAIEIIEEMGFEADYFVSHYWSDSSTFSWNSELAVRFGLVLERVCPTVVVFDGTWPFQGFLTACKVYGSPSLVWSNRGLIKEGQCLASIDQSVFKLIIEPGEIGAESKEIRLADGTKKITVPPVCLLDEEELLDRQSARKKLGLSRRERYVLFSLGPGNLKDIGEIGTNLIRLLEQAEIQVIWARPPISIKDTELPSNIQSIAKYPLARYMLAFDGFVGAAGYNTCYEVLQSRIPSILVPNKELADDQEKRARMLEQIAPVIVSACENDTERSEAVNKLMTIMGTAYQNGCSFPLYGAVKAADAIASLAVSNGG